MRVPVPDSPVPDRSCGTSRTRLPVWRTITALGVSGLVVAGLTASTASAQDSTLRSDQAVARSCFAKPLAKRDRGVALYQVTSTVDGLVQARLRPHGSGSGDWDVAVFDQATGAVVAASAALRSAELAESFVKKGQQLVVQACRLSGSSRTVTLGVDFLAVAPRESTQQAEIVRVETPTRKQKDHLFALGLDVTEKADATGVEVVLAGAEDRKKLTESGMRSTVVQPNLSAKSVENAKADVEYDARTEKSVLPSGRTSYRHLYEYEYELKELARRNPGLVRAFTLPEPTREGRDVVGVEIATLVTKTGDGKPVNFTMGVHHAREWPAGEHAVEWAYELVKGYRAGGELKSLVQKTRNIVVPIVNPDGFSVSREAEPKGDFSQFDYEMKRKNCNASDSPEELRTGACGANPAGRLRGTDPNRNYAGLWGGPGASFQWSSDTYRGSGPFSEPETRNVRSIVSSHAVTNLITLHTYSNLVLRVPGVADVRPPLEEPAYRALGDKLASRNGYKSQPVWQLYDSTGGLEDWSYYATGGWAFTFEVGPDEFHPQFSKVVAEYAGLAPAAGEGKGGNRQAFVDMLANTADQTAHATLAGSAPKGYKLQVRKAFSTPTSRIIQPGGTTSDPIQWADVIKSDLVGNGGKFSWAVNPSTRPYVAGNYGRDPQGPAQGRLVLANPDGVPAPNTDFPNNPVAERIPFRVEGMPTADNGKMEVSVGWGTAGTDWDLYVFDSAGNLVTSSATGGTNSEKARVFDPPAGDYTAVLVNYSQADPAKTDDWANLTVEFSSPLPTTYGPKEPYTLTCSDSRGRLVGLAEIYVDRGQTTDVGDVCTRSARTAKERR